MLEYLTYYVNIIFWLIVIFKSFLKFHPLFQIG